MKITLKTNSVVGAGLVAFLLAMYTIGTISSFLVSWSFNMIMLGISSMLLLYNHLARGGRHISKLVLPWIILTILCFIGFLRGGSPTVLIFYILCLVLILTSEKINIDTLFYSLRWIIFFGLLFALGCYWQLLFPNQYYARLYPLFGSKYQDSIRRQFTFHKMCTGFTSQTAISAQFIILGIMAVLYLYSNKKTIRGRMVSILEMVFLIGGLLLTGKRSPIINLSAAIIVVDMLTVKRSKKSNRILAIALGIIIALTALYFFAPLFAGSRNSLARLLEFTEYENIGEASNGRFTLSRYAISEFLKSPILGIGWGKYGRIYYTTGAHNIYLQLLCECGLIGFILAVGGILFTLSKTIRLLKSEASDKDRPINILLKCSVFIQIYILVYGLFGNPLYDPNYLLMYCMGILIATVAGFNRMKK